jgi:sulfoxide reductase catalytic subunit YedY
MSFFIHPPAWQLREHQVTTESAYFTRRRILKTLLGLGVSASILPLTGCKSAPTGPGSELEQTFQLPALGPIRKNPEFREGDRPLTTQNLASQYNNFYEFGGTKSIWKAAQALPTDPWTLEVGGLVKNPRTYDLDDLRNAFDLEERIYRFRCVEAWSMVLPWVGFPMRKIIEAVEPTAEAKFVRFTSFYDETITPGPGFHFGSLPWPYEEGLRIEEMANDLAFFAVGIYGKELPKQHGAPIRAVLPWKYGFKGAKSIVKIEFLAEQPATYWNSLMPNEYGFEANVNPEKPHPRWSQATERFIGPGATLDWEMKETLLYNGYAEQVGGLYQL